MVLKLTWEDLVDSILQTKRRLILIMPSIHEEWVALLNQIITTNPNIDVRICIDNSEDVVRKGYGSIKSIEELKNKNYSIAECPGLRINFISIDDNHYCLFLESRILEGNPTGYNAILLNDETAQKIISQFFQESNNLSSTDLLSQPLNEEKLKIVQEALRSNPPSEPDLQRQINTYKTHFQYAEIHFEGGGVQSKTITIPKDALPFKDAELKDRMKTRFNLFAKEDTDKWNKLDEIETLIRDIRKSFLHPCKYKKGRNIIDKSKKKEFVEKAQEIKKAVADKKKELIDEIQKAINKSEEVLTKELTDFFESNPPKEIHEIKDDELRKHQVAKIIQKILYNTKIPSASELINKMAIETDYAEFTEEDLSNKEFLTWFKEKGLIDESAESTIAQYAKAYKIKI